MDKHDAQIDNILNTNNILSDKIDKLTISVNANIKQVTDLHVALKEHMDKEEKHYHKYFEAFPGKDARGHHDAHMKMIQEERDRRDFRKKIIQHVITKIVTGAVLFAAGAIWSQFQEKLIINSSAPPRTN